MEGIFVYPYPCDDLGLDHAGYESLCPHFYNSFVLATKLSLIMQRYFSFRSLLNMSIQVVDVSLLFSYSI